MLRRLLSSPLLYGGWAVWVLVALIGTYALDPYLYGFTALILAWLTSAVTIAAVGALALWAWDWTWRRRLLVVAAVAVAVASVARALAILQTVSWT
jgi:hypothetical protein